MTKDEAIGKLSNIKSYLTAWNPMWDADKVAEALDMAIESLENNEKLAEDLQNCLEMYKKKKAEVEALKQPQIIRCKDCIHWKHSSIRPNYCDVWDWCNQADDFCSFVERREEE